jgi:deoxyadenosine/deoxycytidine kinase
MSVKNYIAVEGVIGVGKTSLAKRLAERLGAKLLLEQVEENPFLPGFYRDRRRYAFQTQMFFLLSRYQQQKDFLQQDVFTPRMVSDYIFQKDRIFANINLDDKELVLYERVATILEREIPRPDLIVYLQARLDVLLERIGRRGRPFEKAMDPGYLEALSEAYNYFFFHFADAPLLVVTTNDVDFTAGTGEIDDLLARIDEHPGGTVYYAPASRSGKE